VVDRAELLDTLPRNIDLDMPFVSGERRRQAGPLPVGEPLHGTAQDVADPVQRVGPATTMAVDGLLDPAADLIDRVGSELHDWNASNTAVASSSRSSMAFL